ncbi:MAG TPA: UdgX family uracil-DNA binding protein [Polyangiaceae bacterium]|jgi:DNA polymerase
MSRRSSVALPLAGEAELDELRRMASTCRACALWKRATRTVFGEGPADARMVLVGEQPGDREDMEGRPFVGPAGAILGRALAAAGIDRAAVYVTNAVKHFKWEPRGKRRLHSKPNNVEVVACRPWLEGEIAAVRPHVVVCLGATASQALLGPAFRVTRDRGKPVATPLAPFVLGTLHPSAILRASGEAARARSLADLTADLRTALSLLGRSAPDRTSPRSPR